METFEHVGGVAAVEDLFVLLGRGLGLGLETGVEVDLCLELLVGLLVFASEAHADSLDAGALFEQVGEAGPALGRPELLLVFGLLHGDRFEGGVGLEQLGKGLEALVGENADIKPLDV